MLTAFAERLIGVSRRFSRNAKSNPVLDTNESDLFSKAIELNSNEEGVDHQVFALLLPVIFPSCPALVEELLAEIVSDQTINTIAIAEEFLEKKVIAAVAQAKPNASAMAADFFAHRVRSDSNRRAYSVDNRVNPDAVFWPNPTSTIKKRDLRTELPYVRRTPFIDKQTPISSAGSCFAVEIANALQEKAFNYIVKEPNCGADGTYWIKDYEVHPYPTSSAAWGIHFNTPSFLQLVEKAFELRRPAKILWTNRSTKGNLVFCDPFREEIEFPTKEAFDRNYDDHIRAARSVFLESEVLIITLGLNEVWYFLPDNSVFSRSPWRTAPSLVRHCTLTVQENVDMLQRMLDILRHYNPKLKLIVTLSPVPLHATFLGDEKHIVEANMHSKAVLRVAAEEFVRANSDVFYFPSFELITTCLEDAWDADQRHVSKSAVQRVMTMFHEMYVR